MSAWDGTVKVNEWVLYTACSTCSQPLVVGPTGRVPGAAFWEEDGTRYLMPHAPDCPERKP